MLQTPLRSIPLLAAASLLALCGVATAKAPRRPAPVPVVAVPPISAETLKEVTRTLSSDAYEGRAPGT
ncbi:MAG: hypothetical protein ABL859_03370, partial [Methylotenera sp.]